MPVVSPSQSAYEAVLYLSSLMPISISISISFSLPQRSSFPLPSPSRVSCCFHPRPDSLVQGQPRFAAWAGRQGCPCGPGPRLPCSLFPSTLLVECFIIGNGRSGSSRLSPPPRLIRRQTFFPPGKFGRLFHSSGFKPLPENHQLPIESVYEDSSVLHARICACPCRSHRLTAEYYHAIGLPSRVSS